MSHGERTRIVADMMSGRDARAKEREARRLVLLRRTFKLSIGSTIAFGLATLMRSEPPKLVTVWVLAVLGLRSAALLVRGARPPSR